jgi:hypothetical protein
MKKETQALKASNDLCAAYMLPFIIALISYLIPSWNGFDFDSHSLRVPFWIGYKIRMGHLNIRYVSLKWLKRESAEYGRERNVQLGLCKTIAVSNPYLHVHKI